MKTAHMLSNNMREVRERRGVTLRQLAGYLGCNLGGLWRIEQGTADPKVSTALRLARTLRVPLGDLFELNDR